MNSDNHSLFLCQYCFPDFITIAYIVCYDWLLYTILVAIVRPFLYQLLLSVHITNYCSTIIQWPLLLSYITILCITILFIPFLFIGKSHIPLYHYNYIHHCYTSMVVKATIILITIYYYCLLYRYYHTIIVIAFLSHLLPLLLLLLFFVISI